MKSLIPCCAAVLALVALSAPVHAAPLQSPPIATESHGVVQNVGHRRGFYVVGRHYYYNGYRGIVVARPGYRYYRGYWFPPAAFAAGVIAGSAAARPVPVPRHLSDAHVAWCLDRYRSYRVYDNTYKPYVGPREQCWSPYN